VIAGLLLSLMLTQTQHAPQFAGRQPLEPALEARVQALGKQLRCTVCQGLSIADSPSSMARAQLDTVRSLVSEGKSDEEIKAYFVALHDDWALLSPPKHGFNWVVWLGPLVVLLLGAAFIAQLFKKGSLTAPVSTPPPQESPADDSDDPYLKAVRAELKR